MPVRRGGGSVRIKTADLHRHFDIQPNCLLPPFRATATVLAMPETSLKSVTVVSVCSMVQLMLQFVFQMLLAKYFGASSEMDAYFASMTLPMAISMIATGALANAFVPIFLERREKYGAHAAWETMNSFGCFLVAVSLAVVVLCQLSAQPLMSALHPGFSDEQKQLTAVCFASCPGSS